MQRINTDTVPGLGACAARWMARMFERGGTPSVHAYMFAHPTQLKLPKGHGILPGIGQ